MKRTISIFALLSGLAALPPLAAKADSNGQVVNTESGPVSGSVSSSGRKFLGIPYAAPPNGGQRWKPPTAPQSWSAPRAATQLGSACPQNPSFFGVPSQNEDCLFLN